MNSMPLGLYEYKNTIVHNSTSFIKIICLIILIVSVCLTNNLVSYLFWIVIIFILFKVSKCDYKTILDSLYKTRWLCLTILLMNFLFFSRENSYFTWLIFSPSYIGLLQGINVIGRMCIIIIFGSILVSSTTPVDITKGINMCILPLQYIGVNVYEVSMILSISISFIPILYEEAEQLRKAQMARGANVNNKSLLTRAKSILPFVVPVFICAFKRADDLSLALESRGVNYRNKKIKFDICLSKNDYCILIGCVLILIFVLILRGY